jgi:hypothetical protein
MGRCAAAGLKNEVNVPRLCASVSSAMCSNYFTHTPVESAFAYIYVYILSGAVESRMRERKASARIASRQTPFPLFTFRQRARGGAQDNSARRAQRNQQRTYRERNAVCTLYACAPNFWTRFRLLNRNVYA